MRSISGAFPVIFVLLTLFPVLVGEAATGAGGPPAEQASAEPVLDEPVPIEPIPLEPVPVEARVEIESAWIVSDETGARRLSAVLPPGAEQAERLYTGRFRHVGVTPAELLEIILPVPAEMRYVAGSATGPGAVVEYSVDGGQRFAPPAGLRIPTVGAETAPGSGSRQALPEDYTHVRWRLLGRFPPGTTGLVSFRALPRIPAGEEIESP